MFLINFVRKKVNGVPDGGAFTKNAEKDVILVFIITTTFARGLIQSFNKGYFLACSSLPRVSVLSARVHRAFSANVIVSVSFKKAISNPSRLPQTYRIMTGSRRDVSSGCRAAASFSASASSSEYPGTVMTNVSPLRISSSRCIRPS